MEIKLTPQEAALLEELVTGGLTSYKTSRYLLKIAAWAKSTKRFEEERKNLAWASKAIAREEIAARVIADRLALVRGMEREEILTLARDYIEANPMRYAVTTGNLTYLKKGGK